jgi:hypothetical protein
MNCLPTLLLELEQNTQAVEQRILSLNETEFHFSPSPEKWSPSEVLAHLSILEGFINQVVIGETEIGTRASEEMVPLIHSTFLNREGKMVAPEVITPKPGIRKSQEEMLNKFRRNRNHLIELLQEHDPTLLCKNFKHHFFGELTRIEWGYFVLYHGQRHLQQMEALIRDRVLKA